uniref:MARVEL domain-containing protein n=1 Tax=Rhabditophanes sp. KR3021 TaxID=114890 RepID=A0AC35THI0_9BILA
MGEGVFDQNDKKYLYICKLHVKLVARIIVAIQCGIVLINLIYSMTRSSTIMLYSWTMTAFAIALYGSLAYGVYKEKRNFVLPYLIFQVVSIVLTILIFIVFIIGATASPSFLQHLATDFGSVDYTDISDNLQRAIHSFAVLVAIAIIIAFGYQILCFHVIFAFQRFLADRESFDFNLNTNDMDLTIA